MRRKLKIAMLGQKGIPATFGGVERHVEEIATRLSSRGHQVTVFTRPYYLREALARREMPSYLVSPNGLRVRTVPTLATKHFDAFTHTFLSTLVCLSEGFDILHYHALGPATLAILPKILGRRIVITVHGLDWLGGKWGRLARQYLKWGEKACAVLPDTLVVVSRTLQNYFQEKYHRQSAYLPNGVNLPGQNGSANADFINRWGLIPGQFILFVGRLVPEKGVHLLLDAFRDLKTEKKLVIAGGSSHTEGYLQQLRQRADQRVIFCGFVYGEELANLYRQAYLCVFPSLLEGMPLTLLEALSFGQTILASDIPAHQEVLEGQGFYFQNQNVGDLKQKLGSLLADQHFSAGDSQTRRDHVARNFSWDRVVDDLEEEYWSVLKQD